MGSTEEQVKKIRETAEELNASSLSSIKTESEDYQEMLKKRTEYSRSEKEIVKKQFTLETRKTS
jgi:hypothetical protein